MYLVFQFVGSGAEPVLKGEGIQGDSYFPAVHDAGEMSTQRAVFSRQNVSLTAVLRESPR